MAALRIAETFTSVQGEGHHVGLPMFFVRLQGCSVTSCPLHAGMCDTNWRDGSERSVADVATEVKASGLPCCVTGGEPTDQGEALAELLATCAAPWWMIQTAGVAPLPPTRAWSVVSPKVPMGELAVRSGNELKVIYQPGITVDDLAAWERGCDFSHRFLQPVWQRRREDTPAIVALLADATRARLHWRLSQQSHKLAGLR